MSQTCAPMYKCTSRSIFPTKALSFCFSSHQMPILCPQASCDGIIKVWDQSSMVLLSVIRAFPEQNAGVTCLDVSLDNRMLASGGQDSLKFWSLKDGALLFALRMLPAKVVNIAFSLITVSGPRWVLISCSDGSFWALPFRWDDMASPPAIFSDASRLAVGPSDEPSRNERPPIAQSQSETPVKCFYDQATARCQASSRFQMARSWRQVTATGPLSSWLSTLTKGALSELHK